MAMEDKDIIQLFFDRNEQAIEETSMKYGNYCNSIAMNILKNRANAEECVADTYQNAGIRFRLTDHLFSGYFLAKLHEIYPSTCIRE